MASRAILLVLLLVWASPSRADDVPPEAVIGTLHAALLEVMKEGDNLSFEERAGRLAPTLTRVYDFPLMTRVAVGRSWADLDEATRGRVIDAFQRLSVATYASRFTSFDGETFDVLETRSTDSGDVLVDTRIVPKGRDPVPITYLMRRGGEEGWRIVDVYVNGTISELATKRSEFASRLNQGGPEALLFGLEDKAAALAAP